MHCHMMVYVRIVLTTLITITCLLGDNFVELTQHPLLRALADNATHSIIGALTGIAFSVHFYERTTNLFGWLLIFSCFILSSFIDLDHFVEARSWSLEQATSITRRPLLHCSSIIVALLVPFVCTAALNYYRTSLLLGIMLCAFITHHTRDAIRRGYWLYPFGHTERLPHTVYIIVTITTPYVMAYLHGMCRSAVVQHFLGKFVPLSESKRVSSVSYQYLSV